jgi:hypothetical protein
MTPEQIADELADRILGDVVEELATLTRRIHVGERAFRIAFTDETPGIDADAIVVIEVATGDLYEVEILGVQARRITLPGVTA